MFRSKVVPIDAENVDTDQIVPARYLKMTDKVGLAEALFRDWRFNEDGTLKDPPFILDRPGMAGRAILLVGDNFGSGSSREHAPWALTSWGVRAIFSTGFADIFRSNSLKNGLLPIVVSPEIHQRLRDLIAHDPEAEFTVDLAEEGDGVRAAIRAANGVEAIGVAGDDTPARRRLPDRIELETLDEL
ncbi:MAG: 3-isopropylmalate dehydratase small subunit [Candidatus Limnocylindrales bacterium]